jgi:hypothetical protein
MTTQPPKEGPLTSCALTGRPEQENGSHDDGRDARNHSGPCLGDALQRERRCRRQRQAVPKRLM